MNDDSNRPIDHLDGMSSERREFVLRSASHLPGAAPELQLVEDPRLSPDTRKTLSLVFDVGLVPATAARVLGTYKKRTIWHEGRNGSQDIADARTLLEGLPARPWRTAARVAGRPTPIEATPPPPAGHVEAPELALVSDGRLSASARRYLSLRHDLGWSSDAASTFLKVERSQTTRWEAEIAALLAGQTLEPFAPPPISEPSRTWVPFRPSIPSSAKRTQNGSPRPPKARRPATASPPPLVISREELRARRQAHGLTKPKLARLAGVPVDVYVSIEKGKTRPRPGILERLVHALDSYQPPPAVPVDPSDPGVVLRKWRRAAGLTQAQVGTRLGYQARTISELESGRWRPSPATWDGIASALDLHQSLSVMATTTIEKANVAGRFPASGETTPEQARVTTDHRP